MDFSILGFCQKIRLVPPVESDGNDHLRGNYVLQKVFKPYAHGQLPVVGELDMEKFDVEDVLAVREYVETIFEECGKNCELRNHLRNTAPSGRLSPVFF